MGFFMHIQPLSWHTATRNSSKLVFFSVFRHYLGNGKRQSKNKAKNGSYGVKPTPCGPFPRGKTVFRPILEHIQYIWLSWHTATRNSLMPITQTNALCLSTAGKRQQPWRGDTLITPQKRHRSHLSSKGAEFNFSILSPFCTLALPVHG